VKERGTQRCLTYTTSFSMNTEISKFRTATFVHSRHWPPPSRPHANFNFKLHILLVFQFFKLSFYPKMDRDSSVGIVTGYGLDGPGIESWWEARFFAHVQTGLGTYQASCVMGTGSFLGVKRPGRGPDQPPPSSAEVTNE
jgi:hypothetical protein